MADTVATLIAEVREEGQFDATEAQALNWLNRRHRFMVAGARSFRRRVPTGFTVAGVQDVLVPAGIVEVYDVWVNGEHRVRIPRQDAQAAQNGTLSYSGPSFYAEAADAGGVEYLLLLPAPTANGQPVEIYAAMFPPDLQASDSASALKVDLDLYDALVSGAISTGLLRLEQRQDLAAPHEQAFVNGVEMLKRRVQRRYRPGPKQIRIAGVNT